MKIVILGTAHPYRGGLATFNDRLALQFVNENNNVEVCTFKLQYPSFLFPGKTQFTDSPAPKNLKIERKINSCNPLNWIKVGKEIALKKPDLVIFAYWMSFMAPCMGTIARVIRKYCEAKLISLTHNMIPHEPNFLDKFLPNYFVKTMDGFIALSKSVIEDINKFDKRNCPKIFSPHPIYDHYGERLNRNEALKALNLPTEDKYVLFFGFIRAYKGLDLLLKAFANQKLKNKNIKLIVAGEFYSDEKNYQSLIDELEIREQVILRTDFIPDSEVNKYFSAADIVAQPYKTATQSGVTQIAYHFEKPMLVTNVGGLAEIVPHQKVGYVVNPDAEEIADALIDYFETDRMEQFEKNMAEEKKKYLWSNLTKAISQL